MKANLSESEYNQLIDDTMLAIEDILDELEFDLDYETSGGILTVTFTNESKVILNRQAPVRQLWLAAKSGGYHLDWVDGHWVTDKEQENLTDLLGRVFLEQSNELVVFDFE